MTHRNSYGFSCQNGSKYIQTLCQLTEIHFQVGRILYLDFPSKKKISENFTFCHPVAPREVNHPWKSSKTTYEGAWARKKAESWFDFLMLLRRKFEVRFDFVFILHGFRWLPEQRIEKTFKSWLFRISRCSRYLCAAFGRWFALSQLGAAFGWPNINRNGLWKEAHEFSSCTFTSVKGRKCSVMPALCPTFVISQVLLPVAHGFQLPNFFDWATGMVSEKKRMNFSQNSCSFMLVRAWVFRRVGWGKWDVKMNHKNGMPGSLLNLQSLQGYRSHRDAEVYAGILKITEYEGSPEVILVSFVKLKEGSRGFF